MTRLFLDHLIELYTVELSLLLGSLGTALVLLSV
jgi:hypothetical protein